MSTTAKKTDLPNLAQITKLVKEFLCELFKKEPDIISLIPTDIGWQATAEVVIDEEYTRRRALSDLVHVYEVVLERDGKITSFSRMGIHERGHIEDKESVCQK